MPRLEAKCPTCGGVREVKPSGDGFAMKRHRSRAGLWSPWCDGGSPSTSEVLAWAKAAHSDKARSLDSLDARRKAAHADLAQRLAEIDTLESARRAEVEALARAIKRIEKKVAS